MLPDIWGKYQWISIHLITLGYPDNPTEDDKQHYYEYFQLLQYVLPCAKCRYNLSTHLQKYPLTEDALSSKTTLVKWGIDLHNVVNYYLGKRMLTYSEAMDALNKLLYTPNVNAKQQKRPNYVYYFLIMLVLIIIIVIIVVVYRNYKKN